MDTRMMIELASRCPDSIARMANPPMEVLLSALNSDGNAIQHILPGWFRDHPENRERALRANSRLRAGSITLSRAEAGSAPGIPEELCLAAVRQNGFAVRYISNPTMAVRLEAVRQDPMALEFVRHKSKAIIREAILRDPRSIRFCRRVPGWARDLIESRHANWVEFFMAA